MREREIISRSAEILNGMLVFAGTRVPGETLIQYLKAGDSLDAFLYDFPTVTRDQALAYLALALETVEMRAA